LILTMASYVGMLMTEVSLYNKTFLLLVVVFFFNTSLLGGYGHNFCHIANSSHGMWAP
jgi:hypothetical protein